mmetsp:Transcript_169291/g.411578  ORF Transcript_169291/g.411578 Transcript_169291/m.411578 type:complete len:211 (+) Transcript_169291:1087-1719(+)
MPVLLLQKLRNFIVRGWVVDGKLNFLCVGLLHIPHTFTPPFRCQAKVERLARAVTSRGQRLVQIGSHDGPDEPVQNHEVHSFSEGAVLVGPHVLHADPLVRESAEREGVGPAEHDVARVPHENGKVLRLAAKVVSEYGQVLPRGQEHHQDKECHGARRLGRLEECGKEESKGSDQVCPNEHEKPQYDLVVLGKVVQAEHAPDYEHDCECD